MFIQQIRNFFNARQYIDTITPPLVSCPGIETHLHPFKVTGKSNPLGFLQTSPEFHMKELLSYGMEKIFTIGYSFRDEPISSTHRPQFLMLEWYRTDATYEDLMLETIDLIHEVSPRKLPEAQILTAKEAFIKFTGIDYDQYSDPKSFQKVIAEKLPMIPLPDEELSWDDLFFLVFLNLVEPEFKKIPLLILKDYPASMAALSTLKETDPSVCERFEVYLDGVEISNCFNELRDISVQKERYLNSKKERQDLYGETIPNQKFYSKHLKGGIPQCSGIAVGVERLYAALYEREQPFCQKNIASYKLNLFLKSIKN